MSKGGKYLRQNPSGGKKGKKVVLIVVCVILALIISAVVAGVLYYNRILSGLNQVNTEKIDYAALATETYETLPPIETTEPVETTEETTVPTEPHVASSADYINFLVVGQSERVGEEKESDRYADTMILCTLNTHEKTLTMTSILRDTLIRGGQYMGHTWGGIKLNTVYHMGSQWNGVQGSMEVMNTTLFLNFGIEVDHNFEVDFDCFMEGINLMGGVEIELTEAEANYLNDDNFWVYKDVEPGLTKLNGMTALSFARMRHAEGDNESDIIRTERQRRLIEAIIAKLKTKSLSELQALVDAALPYVTTSMTNAEITEMIVKVLPMITDLEIKKGGTCPANYKGDLVDIYKNGVMHSVLRFNEGETKTYMRAITEGEGVTP